MFLHYCRYGPATTQHCPWADLAVTWQPEPFANGQASTTHSATWTRFQVRLGPLGGLSCDGPGCKTGTFQSNLKIRCFNTPGALSSDHQGKMGLMKLMLSPGLVLLMLHFCLDRFRLASSKRAVLQDSVYIITIIIISSITITITIELLKRDARAPAGYERTCRDQKLFV